MDLQGKYLKEFHKSGNTIVLKEVKSEYVNITQITNLRK